MQQCRPELGHSLGRALGHSQFPSYPVSSGGETAPRVLVKLTNLDEFPICVHRMTKATWDLASSNRSVIPAGDWDVLIVRPGMDVDRFQTILAVAPQRRQEEDEEGICGRTATTTTTADLEEMTPSVERRDDLDGITYDLFEIGHARAHGLFFRSATFQYDSALVRTSSRRRFDLVSDSCSSSSPPLGEVGSIFSALLIPALADDARNVVELVLGTGDDEEDTSGSSPVSRSCTSKSDGEEDSCKSAGPEKS